MKNDSRASAAGAETNDWVDQVTGSAGYEGAVLFFGYAGRSAADPDNSISLYLDAGLGKKLDIRKEDILLSKKTTDSHNLEATLLWVKKSAQYATETETPAASFLQGDIYNAYLGQKGIPTLPVVSCVTCTGIPVVCSSVANATAGVNAQGPIPTLPIEACVPTMPVVSCVTCTGIPFVCSQATPSALNTGPAANAQTAIPTVPVVSCVTCTGIPVVCSSVANATAGVNAQAPIPTLPIEACVPTMPVVSCVTCTGIPFVCAQAPQAAHTAGTQANLQTNIPTMPGFSCVICPTTSSAGYLSARNSGLQAGVQTIVPTQPTSTCFPSTPLTTCFPTAHCTGLPHICTQAPNTQVQGGIRANAQGPVPTLPIEACVPTMPVVSCVTCTGIPFVC